MCVGGLLKHHGAVVVDNHAVLQVPPHRLGQHSALQIAALQGEGGKEMAC